MSNSIFMKERWYLIIIMIIIIKKKRNLKTKWNVFQNDGMEIRLCCIHMAIHVSTRMNFINLTRQNSSCIIFIQVNRTSQILHKTELTNVKIKYFKHDVNVIKEMNSVYTAVFHLEWPTRCEYIREPTTGSLMGTR